MNDVNTHTSVNWQTYPIMYKLQKELNELQGIALDIAERLKHLSESLGKERKYDQKDDYDYEGEKGDLIRKRKQEGWEPLK